MDNIEGTEPTANQVISQEAPAGKDWEEKL
jgi:hypothetical protein